MNYRPTTHHRLTDYADVDAFLAAALEAECDVLTDNPAEVLCPEWNDGNVRMLAETKPEALYFSIVSDLDTAIDEHDVRMLVLELRDLGVECDIEKPRTVEEYASIPGFGLVAYDQGDTSGNPGWLVWGDTSNGLDLDGYQPATNAQVKHWLGELVTFSRGGAELGEAHP